MVQVAHRDNRRPVGQVDSAATDPLRRSSAIRWTRLRAKARQRAAERIDIRVPHNACDADVASPQFWARWSGGFSGCKHALDDSANRRPGSGAGARQRAAGLDWNPQQWGSL